MLGLFSSTNRNPNLDRRDAGRNSCGQFPSIIRMLEERKINIDPWITDRLTLDEVPARFKELSEKVGMMKAVVEVRDSDG